MLVTHKQPIHFAYFFFISCVCDELHASMDTGICTMCMHAHGSPETYCETFPLSLNTSIPEVWLKV